MGSQDKFDSPHLVNFMWISRGFVCYPSPLSRSDWSCPTLTIDNAYLAQRNPPYRRSTNYTVRCDSGLILFNDASSTSYKITCDQDLNWVGDPQDWPKCVESKWLRCIQVQFLVISISESCHCMATTGIG